MPRESGHRPGAYRVQGVAVDGDRATVRLVTDDETLRTYFMAQEGEEWLVDGFAERALGRDVPGLVAKPKQPGEVLVKGMGPRSYGPFGLPAGTYIYRFEQYSRSCQAWTFRQAPPASSWA